MNRVEKEIYSDKVKRGDCKKVNVWTNGRAVRAYVGQDKRGMTSKKTKENGWYKATALIIRDDVNE